MKVAIYIQQGRTQLVLTPENDWEKSVLKSVEDGQEQKVDIMRGAFYECRGGWMREGTGEDSLIIRTGMKSQPDL